MMPAWVLSFCSGFLSLSFELLWVRLVSFSLYSIPQAFAIVLCLYLVGIAIGAWIGKSYCERDAELWKVSGIYLALAALLGIIGPWANVSTLQTVYFYSFLGLCVGITSASIAVVFPIAHHLGTVTTDNRVGRSLSKVYVANILGATLGPVFSGIFLLSQFSTQQAFFICSILTLLLAIACLFDHWRRYVASIVVICVAVWVHLHAPAHSLIQTAAVPVGPMNHIIENQYGIITSYQKRFGGDEIFGGNVYDGRTNLDPIINSNGLNRIFILSALQPQPKKVLMIGLSVGTWLALVEGFPNVESIDVVEINPGYLKLIQDYPLQAQALQDKRVNLIIDDGRRWLRAHPDNRYDLVIMNTTYHWRAYSANLLSKEFLTILKNHMLPNAVLAFNTTFSPDVVKTATTVFPHAYLYDNFIVASDFDWRPKLKTQEAENHLASLKMHDKPLFPPHSELIIRAYLTRPVMSVEELQKLPKFQNRPPFEVVTDNNLITEYKYGLWQTENRNTSSKK